jgi:hypothetical protein
MPHCAPRKTQTFKCLRTCHFMHKMPVNIQKAGAIFLPVNDMVVKYLVIKRLGSGHCD